jgi:hypothetical protein
LPAPLKEISDDFLDIIYEFANAYTEESILRANLINRRDRDSTPSADMFRRLGYSEKKIAEMNLEE